MSTPTLDLSVVVPLHNEAPNLPLLLPELAEVLDGLGGSAEIVFVDDGSTDGSADVVRALRARDRRVRLVRLRVRAGLTAAFDAGFRAARGAVVVTLDADLQNDPRDIPRLLAALEGADLATGCRQARRDPWRKRLASRVGNAVRGWLTGDRIPDSACSLRAYRRRCLPDLRLRDGLHRFVPTILRAAGHRVVEVPVNHRPRRHGRSKFGIGNRALVGLQDVLAVRWMLTHRLSYRAVEEYGQGRIRGLVGPASAPGAPVPARWASPAAAIAAVWMAVALGLWVWGVVDGPGRVHTRARGADELVAVASPPDRGVLSLWVRWNARERAPGWVVLESGHRWEAPAELFWRRRVHPGWNLLIWPALPGPGGGLPLTLRVVESEPASWAVTAPHLSAGYGLVHLVPLRGLLAAVLLAAGVGAASLVTAIRARRLPRPGWWSLAVGAVALAGLALRLRTLVSHGLWFDEILTAIGAQSLAWVLYTPQIFGHPPLQYLAGWLTGHAGSEGLRVPFAVAGAASVAVLGALGRRLFGAATGLAAAMLLAVSPFHIELSQLARPYAFLLLLALSALLALVQALESGTARAWLGWAALAALACYAHYLGLVILVVLGAIAAAWIAADRGRGAGPAAMAFALTITLLLPWLGVLSRQGTQHVGTGAVAPGALADLISGVIVPQFVGMGATGATALGLAAIGLGAALRQRARAAWVAVLWLGGPLAIIWAAQPQHFLAGRHLGFLLPVLLLLVAHGTTALGRTVEMIGKRSGAPARPGLRAAAAATGAAVVLLLTVESTAGLGEYYRERHGPDWRSVAEILDRLVAPGERVVARVGAAYPLRYYWNAEAVVEADPSGLPTPRPGEPGRRVWIVILERWDDDPALLVWLGQHAVPVEEVGPSWSLPRVHIYRARAGD